MLQSLQEYISSKGGNGEVVAELIRTFENNLPPPESFFPDNKHVADCYKEKRSQSKLVSVMSYLIEEALSTHRNEIFGTTTKTKQEAMKIFLYARATHFRTFNVGACSHRASFAALYLAKALKDNENLGVHLVSDPTRDQFVVMFSEKIGSRYFIYDPFSNPQMVFKLDYYRKNILEKIPIKPVTKDRYKLKVTFEMYNEFEQRWPNYSLQCKEALRNEKKTPDEHLSDPAILQMFQNAKIEESEYRQILTDAQEYLDKKIEAKPDCDNSSTRGFSP